MNNEFIKILSLSLFGFLFLGWGFFLLVKLIGGYGLNWKIVTRMLTKMRVRNIYIEPKSANIFNRLFLLMNSVGMIFIGLFILGLAWGFYE